MAMAEIKLKQWGNSLGIVIPREIIKDEELHEGEIIKVEIVKNKRIDGFGIFKGMPSFSKEDEGDGDF